VGEAQSLQPAGRPRRFGALLYDMFMLAGVLFIAALPLPVLDQFAPDEAWTIVAKRGYLLIACFVYLGGFWVHGGQTVGMKAWRVKVVRDDGRSLSWKDAIWRFGASCLSLSAFGLGFLWALVDPTQRTWHDRLSRTHMVGCPEHHTQN
jgi:uncharacterized RDD family membrane protein YckC|tara:strand:- start:5609 stop:6055 length:447 start_codon:yes stop_codon:yes gene_type:complete